ncbi:hypothetical protein M427DRAFT_58956 [Gonapodya prolifera JEL478]|uniref:Uncharacterized protein n=1 Tax=Gonapodya prolifera (strain JEL478) TaxID=1344416 RepID=A0A139A9G8_GONPJ|nr:hypothetical protein M427DRAFT_58956 [Gonapodya prolifera JEL478]|eukprot:KXS13043.1 hypothetical protein M427DRAFT_58956 [Gonapodya prolifera JEL478]
MNTVIETVTNLIAESDIPIVSAGAKVVDVVYNHAETWKENGETAKELQDRCRALVEAIQNSDDAEEPGHIKDLLER